MLQKCDIDFNAVAVIKFRCKIIYAKCNKYRTNDDTEQNRRINIVTNTEFPDDGTYKVQDHKPKKAIATGCLKDTFE